MNTDKQREVELTSVRPRKFKLNLSTKESKALLHLAVAYGVTPEAILEGFIGDLVDGVHTSGCEEQALAQEYLKNCPFAKQPQEKNFMQYMLEKGGVEDFIHALKLKKESQSCIRGTQKQVDDPDFEWKAILQTDYNTGKDIPRYTSREEWLADMNQILSNGQADLAQANSDIQSVLEQYGQWSGVSISEKDAAAQIKNYQMDLEACMD